MNPHLRIQDALRALRIATHELESYGPACILGQRHTNHRALRAYLSARRAASLLEEINFTLGSLLIHPPTTHGDDHDDD